MRLNNKNIVSSFIKRAFLHDVGKIGITDTILQKNCRGGRYPPLIARIFCIVDVFDALTSKRPYKEPFSYRKAVNILNESKGTYFDPELLEHFIEISEHIYTQTHLKHKDQLKEELHNLIKQYFLT